MEQYEYLVKWGGYRNVLYNGFSAMQKRGELVDMSLSAVGLHVPVHKVLVGLISPALRAQLLRNNNPHPVLVLHSVKSEVVFTSILDYMYTGEALVTRENIDEFLKACQSLEIMGFEDLMGKDGVREFITVAKVRDAKNDQSDKAITIAVQKVDMNHPRNSFKFESLEAFLEHDVAKTSAAHGQPVEYFLSARGTLQLMYDGFVYGRGYYTKTTTRLTWYCVESLSKAVRCHARITTCQDRILGSLETHSHTSHKARIMRNCMVGRTFTNLRDAHREMIIMRVEIERAKQASFIKAMCGSIAAFSDNTAPTASGFEKSAPAASATETRAAADATAEDATAVTTSENSGAGENATEQTAPAGKARSGGGKKAGHRRHGKKHGKSGRGKHGHSKK